MSPASAIDRLLERVTNGERLSAGEVTELASSPDILSLGMLADAMRRSLHGTVVTFVRVAPCAFDGSFTGAVPPAAREVRITGCPDSLSVMMTAVESAKAVAGDRAVSGFSWADIERLAMKEGLAATRVLIDLRTAGLDALAEVAMDVTSDLGAAIRTLTHAGFGQLRLTLQNAPAAERAALLLLAADLQDEFGGIQTIDPLPSVLNTPRPTTGYEDVRTVAVARLAAPNIPTIQVNWHRYGPKLAQVALTFGADDLDEVTASDEAPDGRRRAPLEEVKNNIEAAGFSAVERDGRFTPLS